MEHTIPSAPKKHVEGFSLIQMSMVMAVGAILLLAMLPGGEMGNDANKTAITYERMAAIEEAMKAFMVTNLRRPCPANGTYGRDSSKFGLEAENPGSCTGGSSISANFSDASTEAVAGMVPVRSLNLPDEYALDGYGRRIMYVVDKRATLVESPFPSSNINACYDMQLYGKTGDIEIKATSTDTVIKDYVMWALISYGKSGHGAYPMQGGTGRLNASGGSTTSIPDDALLNAFVDPNFGTNFTGQLVRKEANPSSNYDTVVWYNESTKNSCCMGKACNYGFNMATEGSSLDSTAGVNTATGDINGDGIMDLVITNTTATSPIAYVVWGTKTGWPVTKMFNKDNLEGASPTGGFSIVNNSGITSFGRTLAIGDVNGDSYDDIVLGGSQITVVFGGPSITSSINTSALNGTNGLRIQYTLTGTPGDVTVAKFNTDDYADIVFSAGLTSNRIWGLFGTDASGWAARAPSGSWDAEAITLATDGFVFDSPHAATFPIGHGLFAMAHGDVNGDGHRDLLMGDATASGSIGKAYVLFGGAGFVGTPGTPPSLTVSFDGTQASYFHYGPLTRIQLGISVAAADMNNDGIDDIIMGSNGPYVYIHAGTVTWTGSYDINASYATRINITASKPSWIYQSASSVLRASDINNDGRTDLLIGVRSSSACVKDGDTTGTVGSIYALFQPATGWPASANLFQNDPSGTCNGSEINTTSLNGGTACATTADCAFRIDGPTAGEYAYIPLVTDLNRDSKKEIVVAAPGHDSGVGAIYAIYGRRAVPWDSMIDLAVIAHTDVAALAGDGGEDAEE
ncbi:MAG: VCBS repeat-containing protein [Phycisphaerae bacterium]|nr:VCBS repeat-containing protein [Phycisphaerae bacterium]MCZ2400087.1 VCBS repeat-containing protein [Phycisphaerae bacterium]